MLFDFPRGLLLLKAGTGRLVEDTATGNPLTFNTNVAKPLKSLLIPFTPVQSGTGDPSPDNVRPIAGITGLTAYHAGKNLFDKNAKDADKGYIDRTLIIDTGETWDGGSNFYVSEYIPVVGGCKYTISKTSGSNPAICFYDGLKQFISGVRYFSKEMVTVTAPINARYCRFAVPTGNEEDFQLEVGETATPYAPYTGESFPVDWTDEAGTVYGGTLDVVTGVLTVEWRKRSLNSFDAFNVSTSYAHPFFYGSFLDRTPGRTTDFMCEVFKKDTVHVFGSSFGNEAEDLSVAFSGDAGAKNVYFRDDSCETREAFLQKYKDYYIAYKLATPQEIQLTPEQITALVGDNTIWSDTNGENTAVYLKKA